ncbi:MAG: hypothetical protein C0483_18725 [Pirellula sp.]|nr:hypothetical protein [Pirellula sp.]
MPNSFAESSDGLLLIADGMGKMLRWDGRSSFAEPAGVAGPTAAIVMTPSLVGEIVGTYRAYLRYIDQYGNVSNLSPVSTELDVNGATGSITDASNAVPIIITSAAHGLTNGSTVKIAGVEGNEAANGTWAVTVIGTDTFSLDGSAGDGAYRGAGAWVRGVGQITYTSVQVPSDPTVVTRQILRNTDGQMQTFYVDVETSDMLASTFVSTKSDNDLIDSEPVPLLDDAADDIAVSRYTQPPDDRKFIANMLGRMFGVGEVRYSQGAVIVTFGSSAFTGIGTEFTEAVVDRFLTIDGAPKPYQISSINIALQTGVLAEPYLGPDDPYSPYTIRTAASRRRAVDYSEAGLPEAWPPTNSLEVEADSQADELTGLMRHGSFLYVLHRSRMRRLTFQNNPSPVSGDGGLFLAADRGCVNSRSLWIVEDVARLMDSIGVHEFTGNTDVSISDAIRPLFTKKGDGTFKIQWQHAENFHAVYDPGTQIMRWFVCLDGGRYPRHAVALDHNQRRWWIEEYYRPVASSCLGKLDGQDQVYIGTNAAQVLALGAGELDGPDPAAGTTRGSPTAIGLTWLADSAATFAADLVNAPVHIVDGPGRGQWRTIVAVADGVLSLDRPWLELPTTASTYQVGGVAWTWRSSTMRWTPTEASAPRRVIVVAERTEHPAIMAVRLFSDRETTPDVWGRSVGSRSGDGVKTTAGESHVDLDLTKRGGHFQFAFPDSAPLYAGRKRFVDVEMSGVKGRDPQTIYECTLDGAEQ